MTKTYKAGEIICTENTFENWMYEIVSGRVEVIKSYGKEEQVTLAELTEGFFGEMSLLDCLPRTATVIAKEDTEVKIIDEELFAEYMNGDPEKVNKLLICLTVRLSKLNSEYLEACKTVKRCLQEEKKEKSLLVSMKRFAQIFRMR